MKAILSQIALIIGSVVAAVSLAINLTQDIDLLTAAFRAVIVFLVTVTLIMIFLRYFAAILVRFVAEQVMKQSQAQQEEENNGTTPATRRSRISASTRTPNRT